ALDGPGLAVVGLLHPAAAHEGAAHREVVLPGLALEARHLVEVLEDVARDRAERLGTEPPAAELLGQAQVEEGSGVLEVLEAHQADPAQLGMVEPEAPRLVVLEGSLVDRRGDLPGRASRHHVEREHVRGEEGEEMVAIRPAGSESAQRDRRGGGGSGHGLTIASAVGATGRLRRPRPRTEPTRTTSGPAG